MGLAPHALSMIAMLFTAATVGCDEDTVEASPLFEKLEKPRPGDWLDVHSESHISFETYRAARPVRPSAKRRTILLQPLGVVGEAQQDLVDRLAEWAALFFALPTRQVNARSLQGVTQRINGYTGKRQYLTTEILDEVLRPKVHRDALCLVGVTFEDLYPDPTWNFVFGQASLRDRVGVYSLARYSPEFFGEAARADSAHKLLIRGMKVVTHETGHIFGITHCVKYNCLMNGSNSLQESDRRTMFLCPDCLEKLAWNIGFEKLPRYHAMLAFLEREGLTSEAHWMRRRIAQLQTGGGR